jgi:hypothetical protein
LCNEEIATLSGQLGEIGQVRSDGIWRRRWASQSIGSCEWQGRTQSQAQD